MRLIPIPEPITEDIFHFVRFIDVFSCYPDLAEGNPQDILQRFNAICVYNALQNREESIYDIWKLFPSFSFEDNLDCIASFGGKEGLLADRENRKSRGSIAGKILLLTQTCHEKGEECGIRRSKHVLRSAGGEKFKSKKYIGDAWTKFKSMAHFHASRITTDILGDRDKAQIEELKTTDTEAYLLCASMLFLLYLKNSLGLYKFAITRRDKRYKDKTMIGEDEAWIFPPDVMKDPSRLFISSRYSGIRDVLSGELEFGGKGYFIDDKTKKLLKLYRSED
jgi:hypothetical protein